MLYFSLFVFAVLPSFVWLLYFLKKDVHPEPKRVVAYVFSMGALLGVAGYFFQINVFSFFAKMPEYVYFSPIFFLLFQKFIIIAFSEEFLKYLAFFFTVKRHTELDEPMDIIIYMITAAMGFAALENFLLLFSADTTALGMFKISVLRFISATFFHALASGILGVFLIYGYRFLNKFFIFSGFLVVTLFHGTYNILAMRIEDPLAFFLIITLLVSLSLILSFGISKAKEIKSVSFPR